MELCTGTRAGTKIKLQVSPKSCSGSDADQIPNTQSRVTSMYMCRLITVGGRLQNRRHVGTDWHQVLVRVSISVVVVDVQTAKR